MNEVQSRTLPAPACVVIELAGLFQRLDASPVKVDPDQYRLVARRLAAALADVSPQVPLQAVLDANPAAAELYENLNYQFAGLCRSPLEASLNAELAAKFALQRAALVLPRQT